VYTSLLMEQAGRALSREPLVGTGVIAAQLVPFMSEPWRSEFAAAMGRGEAVIALAHGEPKARFDLAHVETRADASVRGFMLHGTKSHVPDGAAADWFIVPARTSGMARDRLGISLFLLPAAAHGLTRRSLRGADYRHNAQLQLNAVAVGEQSMIGEPGQGLVLLERVVDHAIVAGLAEALGMMEALRDLTLEYLKTREQFGVRIGSFQALQHRMVDMEIACEEARAMVWQATASLGADARQRRRAVCAAKTRVGQTSLYVGHQAVQLHGGIGTTDDLIVSHYLKRLLMLESSYGNADFHRQRFLEAAPAAVVA
jgi:alkylation response protein AidB-like acyl-CoA dehydrogenase